MKVRIEVFLREAVLDAPGDTLARELEKLGYRGIQKARIGKAIELEYSGQAPSRETLEKMCDSLLANPVMESYAIEIQA